MIEYSGVAVGGPYHGRGITHNAPRLNVVLPPDMAFLATDREAFEEVIEVTRAGVYTYTDCEWVWEEANGSDRASTQGAVGDREAQEVF